MYSTHSQHLQLTLQLAHGSKGVRVTVLTLILERKERSTAASLLMLVWALSLTQEFCCIISFHLLSFPILERTKLRPRGIKRPAQGCPRPAGLCFPAGERGGSFQWGETWPRGGSGSTQTEKPPLAQPSARGGRQGVGFNICFTGFPGSGGNWVEVWYVGPAARDGRGRHVPAV